VTDWALGVGFLLARKQSAQALCLYAERKRSFSIDEHKPRRSAFRFSNVLSICDLDVDDALGASLAEMRGQMSGVEDLLCGGRGPFVAGNHDVSALQIAGMEPQIEGARDGERESVIVGSAFADEDRAAVGGKERTVG